MTYTRSPAEQTVFVQNSEFRGAPESCHKMIEHIIYLRRWEDVEKHRPAFFKLLEEKHEEFLQVLTTRWHVSILDTIADHSDDLQQRAAVMLIVQTVNMTKLFETYLDLTNDPTLNQSKIDNYGTKQIWDGVWTMNPTGGDMPINMFRRIDEIVENFELISPVWEVIKERISKGDNPIARLQKHHKHGYFNVEADIPK